MGKNPFVKVMEAEMIPALGCTEPVLYALGGAVARKHAPGEIKSIEIIGSGLVTIGVQSVGIPNTGGKTGGYLSTVLGVLAGDADLDMEVLNKVTPKDVEDAEALIAKLQSEGSLKIDMVTPAPSIYLKTILKTDKHTAIVSMWSEHNGVKYIEVDGKVIMGNKEEEENAFKAELEGHNVDSTFLSIESIYDFCDNADISELTMAKEAIKLTKVICKDGLDNKFGLQTGRIIQENIDKGIIADDEIAHILKWTVAGLDARMGGSDVPAMSNTGSGNQGMVCSMPPIACGDFLKKDEEAVLRAVAFSNLVNIYLDYKSNEYAHLSPMCYCAGVAPAAGVSGVAYLHGHNKEQISDMVRTTLGNFAGAICDGAKPSCAYRAHTGIYGALIAMLMAEKGIASTDIEGIVNKTVEGTIDNIYKLQKNCMSDTDEFVCDVKKRQGTLC